MKFKKMLSSILLETIFANNANIKANERVDVSDDTKSWYVAGGIVGTGVIGVGVYYIYQKNKKKKEIERRKKEIESLPPSITKFVAEKLINEFPFSEQGKSLFDNLIKCKNNNDIQDWAGADIANSGWESSKLTKIDNVLTTKNIICNVLKNQIEKTWKNEIEKARNKAIYEQNQKSRVGLTYDSKDGLKPVFMF